MVLNNYPQNIIKTFRRVAELAAPLACSTREFTGSKTEDLLHARFILTDSRPTGHVVFFKTVFKRNSNLVIKKN